MQGEGARSQKKLCVNYDELQTRLKTAKRDGFRGAEKGPRVEASKEPCTRCRRNKKRINTVFIRLGRNVDDEIYIM